MARKKVVTTREELDGKEAEVTELKLPEDEDSDDILESLLGTDGRKYRVHKMSSKPGEGSALCDDYTKEDFDPIAIRATFGGGRYRITVFDEKNKIMASKQIVLAEVPKSNLLIDQNPRPAQADAMQMMMMQFIKGQSDMVAALLSRETQAPVAGPTAMELVTLIKALQPEAGASNPVDLLMKGLELGRGLGGEGGTDWMDLAKTGLTAAVSLASKAPTAPAPAVRQAPPPQIQNGAAAAAPPKEPTAEEREKMDILKKLNWLRSITADLVRRAAREKDPELYAEVFLDNLPDFISLEEVAERFRDPNAVAMLAQLDPAVTAYAPWFESFRAAVNEMITQDDDELPGADGIDADRPGHPESLQ